MENTHVDPEFSDPDGAEDPIDTVVGVVAADDRTEPAMLHRDGRVHPMPHSDPHLVEFASQSPPIGPPLHDETSLSAAGAHVRKAEERKRLASPHATLRSKLG